MNISLDYKDVAAKLFEQFRECIREDIKAKKNARSKLIFEMAYTVNELGYEVYLSNCVETFKYLDEKFYQELKAQIIWYIEGEIQGP